MSIRTIYSFFKGSLANVLGCFAFGDDGEFWCRPKNVMDAASEQGMIVQQRHTYAFAAKSHLQLFYFELRRIRDGVGFGFDQKFTPNKLNPVLKSAHPLPVVARPW